MAVETLTFNTVRETLTINGQSFTFNCSASTASTGDMLASVYDPTGVVGDAFDHGNLAGLSDDDHTQYHNDTRGDARYRDQTGALGNLGATPSFTGVDGTTYTAAYSANVTSWAGITIASGAGVVIGPITNGNPWTVATTGLTAIESGALDDIAAPGVVLVLANIGGTIHGRASLPA